MSWTCLSTIKNGQGTFPISRLVKRVKVGNKREKGRKEDSEGRDGQFSVWSGKSGCFVEGAESISQKM